jgi:hypothetical protein
VQQWPSMAMEGVGFDCHQRGGHFNLRRKQSGLMEGSEGGFLPRLDGRLEGGKGRWTREKNGRRRAWL